MKREWDLISKILEYVEEYDNGRVMSYPRAESEEFEAYSPTQIEYHSRLCKEAGYVHSAGAGRLGRLTWEGHEVIAGFRKEPKPF